MASRGLKKRPVLEDLIGEGVSVRPVQRPYTELANDPRVLAYSTLRQDPAMWRDLEWKLHAARRFHEADGDDAAEADAKGGKGGEERVWKRNLAQVGVDASLRRQTSSGDRRGDQRFEPLGESPEPWRRGWCRLRRHLQEIDARALRSSKTCITVLADIS